MAIIVSGDMYIKLDGQLHEIKNQLRLHGGYPYDSEQLSHALQRAIEGKFEDNHSRHETEIIVQSRGTTSPAILSTSDQWRSGMVKLYQNHMGLDITPELEKFQWPSELPQGFNWSVFRPQGLTAKMALDKLCKPQFKVVEYINLNDYSLERQTDQPHLVLCRDTVEPDKEWLNQSGDDMSATTTPFLDICERIILEATYFYIFKKHLDIKGLTRCPRSRHGGTVANAYWDPDYRRFKVNANYRGNRCPADGGREAIPLTLKTS